MFKGQNLGHRMKVKVPKKKGYDVRRDVETRPKERKKPVFIDTSPVYHVCENRGNQ